MVPWKQKAERQFTLTVNCHRVGRVGTGELVPCQ